MMRNYFGTELKRGRRILPVYLGSMLAFCLCLVGILVLLGRFLGEAEVLKKVQVGVVAEGEQEDTKLLFSLLSGMESVASVSEFQYLTKEQADEKLHTGKISIEIVIPEDFYDAVMVGEKSTIQVYFQDDLPISRRVFTELLMDSNSMLQTGQSALDAIEAVDDTYTLTMSVWKMETLVSDVYIDDILNRGKTFSSVVVSPLGEWTTFEYGCMAGVTALLFISGIPFASLYRETGKSFFQKLRSVGIGSVKYSIVKISTMGTFLWIVTLLLYAVGCTFWEMEFHWINLILLAVYAGSISSFLHCCYSVVKNQGDGAMLVFLSTLVFAVTSGAIVPLAFMPEMPKVFQTLNPVGKSMTYLGNVLFYHTSFNEVLMQLSMFLIFLLLAAVSVSLHVREGMSGE